MDSTMNPASERGRSHKLVSDVMHRGLVTCLVDTPIPQVAQLMTSHDVSAIPVIDNEGHLAGIITRTDLVTLRAYEEYWRAMKAENVMVTNVATVTPVETVERASKVLSDNKIHRLIVVEAGSDGRVKPVGIISQTDIVRDMALE